MDHVDKENERKQAPDAEVSEAKSGERLNPPDFTPTSNTPPLQKKDNPESEDKSEASSSLEITNGGELPNSNPTGNAPFQLKTENTSPTKNSLPPNLQSNMEAMSGIGLGDVKVHQNSSAPGNLGAHAYAQGSDIHIAPGQEKHLPHEAWHIVQQKQGRVQANTAVNGTAVNDNPGLENEADKMGEKAASSQPSAQLKKVETGSFSPSQNAPAQLAQRNRKKNKKKKKKKNKQKNKNKASSAPAEKGWFEEGTYSGGLASMFTGWSEAPEEDESGFSFMKDGIKGEQEDVLEGMIPGSNSAEGAIGDEEEEGGLIDSITINLISHKGELDNGAETELNAGYSADGFKGSGEIEIKAAKEGKIVKDGFIWDKTDGLITTQSEGEIEGFAGAKAKAEGEASFDKSDYSASASGKASAFAGGSVEGSVNVNVLVNGVKTFAGKGTLGLTAGVGIEGGFHISWKGGQFKMGGKGKVAAGVGFSGGYEIMLDPKSIISGMASGLWSMLGY